MFVVLSEMTAPAYPRNRENRGTSLTECGPAVVIPHGSGGNCRESAGPGFEIRSGGRRQGAA